MKKYQEPFRLKVALLKNGLTVTELAKKIGYSRPNVSKAINHGGFPGIRRKIQEVLRA